MRRAECQRRDRRRWEKKRVKFTKNPFKYLSGLLGVKRSGVLKASKEEVEEHLRKVHSDPRREEELDLGGKLCCPEEPTISFDDGEPRWQEVNDFIRRARGRSAPGPNGILYRKNCKRLRRHLWKLLKVVWRKNHLPDSFLIAERCFIPKQEDSSSMKDNLAVECGGEGVPRNPSEEADPVLAQEQVH